MSQEEQLSIIRCAGCGEFLPNSSRVTRRFHDSSCRSRFFRRKRDIELHSQLIQVYIAEWLDDGLDADDEVRIAEAIGQILLTIGIRTVRSWLESAERMELK